MKKRVKSDISYHNFFPENHRGMSTVITSILLILLVLVAVSVVWVVVKNVVGDLSGDIQNKSSSLIKTSNDAGWQSSITGAVWEEVGGNMYYIGSGNIGIGTASPSSDLSFGTGATVTRIIGLNSADGSDNGRLDIVGASASGSSRGASVTLNGNERPGDQGVLTLTAGDSGTEFINFRTGSSNRMRILNNGNVGIGTTSPNAKLQIRNGDIYLDTLNAISFRSGGVNERAYLKAISDAQIELSTRTGSGFISFATGNAVEAMRIDTSGNVGIGTTSPTQKLHVVGNIIVTGCIQYNGGTLGTCI